MKIDTVKPPIDDEIIIEHDKFPKKSAESKFRLKIAELRLTFDIPALVKDACITTEQALTVSAKMPEKIWRTYFNNTGILPVSLKRMKARLVRRRETDPEFTKEELLGFVKKFHVSYPNSELLRLCIRRLREFYRLPGAKKKRQKKQKHKK